MPTAVLILGVAIAILTGSLYMSAALDRLTASVATLKATAASVVVPAPVSDDAALTALADEVDGINASLAALVPAAPVVADPATSGAVTAG